MQRARDVADALRRSAPTRRATRRRLVAAALAVLASGLVHDSVRSADAARRSWGATARVVVVRHDVAAGAVLGPDVLALVELPAVALPDGTLVDPPVGRRATTALRRGEVLVDRRLAAAGAGAAAAVLAPGTVALGVTTARAAPAVAAGDVVDLWAPTAPGPPDRAAASGPGAARVAVDAVVVQVGDGGADGWIGGQDPAAGGRELTVAVRESDVAATAAASAAGPLTVAVPP